MRCKYREDLVSIGTFECDFVCDEETFMDGFCIFHHPEAWKKHEKELRESLLRKIDEANEKGEPLMFIGYHIPNMKLTKKDVKVKVFFNKAKFHGNIEFSDIKFHDEVYFDDAVFEEKVEFNRVMFSKHTSFSEAEFEKNVSFNETIFHEWTSFVRTRFSGLARIYESSFNEVSFEEAKFSRVEFISSRFIKFTNFVEVSFSDTASFDSTKFKDEVTFCKSDFHKDVSFWKTKFHKNANFADAKFWSYIKFNEAEFYGNVSFAGARFYSDVNFEKTIFAGIADLSSAGIFGEMKFNESEFKSGLLFRDIEFFYMNPLKISKERVSFRRVSFEDPQRIVFDNLDMSYVSLIHTNVSRVQFRNVVWREDIGGYMPYDAILLFLAKSKKYRKRYFKNARKFLLKIKEKLLEGIEKIKSFDDVDLTVHAIVGYGDRFPKKLRELLDNITNTLDQFRNFNAWEEFILSEISRDRDITLENVLSVYRHLRENYDYYLKYEGSGKFFIGEMEAKRLFAEMRTKRTIYSIESFYDKLSRKCSALVLRLVLTLYRYISLYGESLLRPIIWIFATILFFSLLRTILIVHVAGISDIPRIFYSALLGENLPYSLAVFFQLVNGSRWDIIIERLTAIPIVSSLYIALRRKLERRIRH